MQTNTNKPNNEKQTIQRIKRKPSPFCIAGLILAILGVVAGQFASLTIVAVGLVLTLLSIITCVFGMLLCKKHNQSLFILGVIGLIISIANIFLVVYSLIALVISVIS